jgi:hypothetical protein
LRGQEPTGTAEDFRQDLGGILTARETRTSSTDRFSVGAVDLLLADLFDEYRPLSGCAPTESVGRRTVEIPEYVPDLGILAGERGT